MSKIRKFFQYLYIVFTFGPIMIFYHIFFTKRYATHPEKYDISLRYAFLRKEVLILFKLWHVSYHVTGWNNYKDSEEKCIILSNHMADIDPLFYIAMSKKPICFVAKKEVAHYPFVGAALKSIGGIFIDRHNLMNQVDTIKEIVKTAKEIDQPNVVIFLEGKRNKNPAGNVLEYKAGTVKTSYMAKVDIIPATLYGTFRILNISNYLKKYPVYFDFAPRIHKEEYASINSVTLAETLEKSANNIINNKFRKLDKEIISKSNHSKRIIKLETRVDQ